MDSALVILGRAHRTEINDTSGKVMMHNTSGK